MISAAFIGCLLSLLAPGLQDVIPTELPETWEQDGDIRLFEGSALFRHINGGAEVYHGNGFVALAVVDYSSDSGEVRLELYDMGSPEGAAAQFGANTAGLTTDVRFGTASSVDQYQVIFHQDRYYVSITSYTGSEADVSMMHCLADAVSGNITTVQ